MENFMTITQRYDTVKYLESINKKALLIYSPTSMKIIHFSNDNLVMLDTHSITKNKEKIDSFIKENSIKYEMVIGYGGGTAIDIAKYIAYNLNASLVLIPSMLSTNAYATNKVSLLINNKKQTIESRLADVIILDEELIKKSIKQNLYGVADIFSIHTALIDWKIASMYNNEIINENIFNEAQDLLQLTINFINNNSLKKICNSIFTLYRLIGISGEITNKYGNGRPESGSEHIFAKKIEEMIKIPHGISVSVGIICMSIIQNNYKIDIVNCIKKLNVLSEMKKYGLTENMIIDTLKNLTPRDDRFSVVNIYNKDEIDKEYILNIIRDTK